MTKDKNSISLFEQRIADKEWLRGIKGVKIEDLIDEKDSELSYQKYKITIDIEIYKKIKSLFE